MESPRRDEAADPDVEPLEGIAHLLDAWDCWRVVQAGKDTVSGIDRLWFDDVIDACDLLDAEARAGARLRARQRRDRGT